VATIKDKEVTTLWSNDRV